MFGFRSHNRVQSSLQHKVRSRSAFFTNKLGEFLALIASFFPFYLAPFKTLHLRSSNLYACLNSPLFDEDNVQVAEESSRCTNRL